LNSPFHRPVLVNKVIELLITDKSGIYVDCTLGGGGHCRAILESLSPEGKVIAMDIDQEAIQYSSRLLKEYRGRITIRRENFRHIGELLHQEGISKVQGIFLDLGVSSHQLETPSRGFSYKSEGPLDMRMDREQEKRAFQVVNFYEEEKLKWIFQHYGEERFSGRIARAIVKEREKGPIDSTQKLVQIILPLIPGPGANKTLSRIFQAIRIEVNRELENLRACLEASMDVLDKGGRIAVIAYHSLEDRIVKSFFKDRSGRCVCPPGLPKCVCRREGDLKILTKKPVTPDEDERRTNPRSRSAKLRVAEKL